MTKPKVTASCTWGEGPDVLLINQGAEYMLYKDPHGFKHGVHGFSSEGSVHLTAAEAKALAGDLLMAAGQAEGLDKSYEDYVKQDMLKVAKEIIPRVFGIPEKFLKDGK
jgi:hypothetical protein